MNLSSTNKPNVNFSMSSMTDVIFILLIFFLITSTLKSPSQHISAWPNMPIGDNLMEIFEDDNQIIVRIVQSPDCDSYMYIIPGGSYCGWKEAEPTLNNLKIDVNKIPTPVVIMAPEESIPYVECANVLDFAAKNKISCVPVGVLKE